MKKWLIIMTIGLGLPVWGANIVLSEPEEESATEAMAEAPEDAAQEMADEAVEKGEMKVSDSSEWGVPNSARAIIKGTQEGSAVSGRVDLVQTGDGIQVVASLSHVEPAGKHGLHIHAQGSCDDGGKAAGGHFNPGGTQHGLLPRDGETMAHAGDMGNITIDENGNGSLVIFMPGLSLVEGASNVAEKAIILHEKEDDFGQPTGNAGGRIGCGIIELNK